MPPENAPTYSLTIDLTVLDHLADGLYSSVAAVLTEAVANAWDADARTVHLDLDIANDAIVIRDDGIGMTPAEVNDRYLRVGYRRRSAGDVSEGLHRPVMGRKGIGKLSLFSIADEIRLETRREGGDIAALVIDVPALRDRMEEGSSNRYEPPAVAPEHDSELAGSGTLIRLSRLKPRLRDARPESLRRRLARRFSVIGGDDFRVFVNGTEVTSADREDLKFVQYLWVMEGSEVDDPPNLLSRFTLHDHEAGWPDGRVVRGWIGTVDRPKQLSTPEGNLNSIVVMSRGRLVQEDILPKLHDAGIFASYVTGQIEADWLDASADDDIVTSDRQRLREDDPRVNELVSFLSARMREIANRWSELRVSDKADELRAQYPRIDDWLERLDSGWRRKAETLLGRIAAMPLPEESEPVEARKDLVRHAIYGFERLRMRGDAESLERALDEGVDTLLKLLADRDALEASMYRDIARNRLDAVTEFASLVDENQKERVLQKYLFEHLWLLDPSWDRATDDEAMEERIKLLPEFTDDTNDEYGRIDIRYKAVSGKHLIVELKRAGVRPSAGTLLDQVKKYKKALEKRFPHRHFEVIVVLGENVEDAETSIASIMPGSKVFTYDELIVKAKQAYSEYLERTKEIDFIDDVLS